MEAQEIADAGVQGKTKLLVDLVGQASPVDPASGLSV